MQQPEETPPVEYISYNGMGRSPMIWGVPYMFALFFGAGSLLAGMLCGLAFGPGGFLLTLVAIPVLLYVRGISSNDDQAINILLIELKWTVIKLMSGNSKYYGGTLTITPSNYGRRASSVKRYFKAAGFR